MKESFYELLTAFQNLSEKVPNHYRGDVTVQSIITIEEMSELTKELTKVMRGKGNTDHLYEEYGDVVICLAILMKVHDIDINHVFDECADKFKRLTYGC